MPVRMFGENIEPASMETVHPRNTPYFMDRIFVIPCSNYYRHINHRKTVYTTHINMIRKKGQDLLVVFGNVCRDLRFGNHKV